MGDIADMILDGTLDMYTGEFIGEPCGYPRTFEQQPSKGKVIKKAKIEPSVRECPECGSKFGDYNAVRNHARMKHKKLLPKYTS